MNRLSNGILDFANMAVCSGLLVSTYDAIPDVRNQTQNVCSVTVKDSGGDSGSGPRIIAFVSCDGGGDSNFNDDISLVDSGYASFPMFVFLNTEVNPSVSIRKAAIELFASIYDQLSVLKDQIDINRPLIITGRSLGGSVASLFTLWLLDTTYLKTSKTPICLTFGSPLLGDNALQRAISERPTWISCFLHVISNQDPVPRSFAKGHMPFGATLFISESGCACFEDPQSILELIEATSLGKLDEESQFIDYGSMLKKLKYKAIRQGKIEDADACDISDPVQCGITLQLLAIEAIKPENSDTSPLIPSIRRNMERFQKGRKNNSDQTKKLNEVKVYMACMGWYKKQSKNQGGYYDCYKTAESKSKDEGQTKEDLVIYQKKLNQYWKKMVKDVDRMPKREGATSIRPRVLYAGTNYRRMVEPLDIAVYYRQGNKDYINKGRSQHYKLLEEWEKASSKPAERHKVSSTTEDSCFWAHVEEALIACRSLTEENDSSTEDKESWNQSLLGFEAYVMGLIRMQTLSPETFQEGSSFMKWWKDYKRLRGIGYKSGLTGFMNNEKVQNDLLVLDEYKVLS